jgi:hypothetical protein
MHFIEIDAGTSLSPDLSPERASYDSLGRCPGLTYFGPLPLGRGMVHTNSQIV